MLVVEPGPVIDEVEPVAPPWLLPVAPAEPVEFVDVSSPHPGASAANGTRMLRAPILICPSYHTTDWKMG